MFLNDSNTSLWPCFKSMRLSALASWNIGCVACRFGAMIILLIAMVCFALDVRYLRCYYRKQLHNGLVLSLFLASLLLLVVSVPSVLLQLFTCHRHCNEIYCRIEGFVSYMCGCVCMLIYMVLSINRYLLLCQYHQPFLHRYSAILCWLFSIAWTLPPVFHYWISYVPEGHGFHCSIDWKDQSRSSRFYVLFSFLSVYFVPLVILFTVNVRVHQIIRQIYSSQTSFYLYQQISYPKNLSPLYRRKHHQEHIFYHQSSNTITYVRKAADRKRLRIEYRSMQAIIVLVSTYIIAWTPYSIVAVLQLFHVEFVFQQPFLITLSAFFAKLSVIVAPLVYLSIMHFRLFKKILF